MGSEGIQITIPDFDEEDYHSTPIFGRSQGGLWGASSSGQDSPTILTPLALPERAEKSYFHARGDSITSDDSAHSLQYSARKVKSPFAHSAQSSFATTTTGGSSFTKKPSFASLRNAFRKNTEPAPPLPPIEHQVYPALKNPFSRSTSSLAQHPPMPHRQQPSMHASPPHFRPSTPASSESRTRGTPSRAREHAYARSQHSHSGSIFHNSDAGSDQGFHTPSSPPPVPRMPAMFNPFGHPDDSRTLADLEDKITMEPRTPSDYALHAIFIRFATTAEGHIEHFLRLTLDREPLLTDYMGPGVDPKLDELLLSLGKIAQKHAKAVVESVMRWRKSHADVGVSPELLRGHLDYAATSGRNIRGQDVSSMLNERRSLASIYVMCRALIAATQNLTNLEELTFDQFRRPDIKMLTQSANHRINAELYATLLGQLANVRFESVTDRFLVELGPVAAGQVPKDADFKYENLVRGLKHVPIKVWPPEAFEEGAEFMASLAKSFENAHGNRLKTTFAETLVHVLHPIAKTAQAEVNHPDWAKAIDVIFPRVRDMMAKPRYWHVAYPLAVTSLCVAPQEIFLRNWTLIFDAGLGKLKEKVHRVPVLNGMLRLMWTYLYRCPEPASTVAAKLDPLIRHFFPPNRSTIHPQEDSIEPLTYMLHYVLSRHFDFGSELCLELLQERSITTPSPNMAVLLAPERTVIAAQAILLSLHAIEREETTPSWPSSSDFTVLPSRTDYPTSSEFFPPSMQLKAGWTDLVDRSSTCLKAFAMYCYQAVGTWSILDDQWSAARLTPTYEDSHGYTTRAHPEAVVAYSNQYLPQVSMLRTVYQSWPRCLHPSMAVEDAFDMLLRGVVHVEPAVGEAAGPALQRFMADSAHATTLLSRFAVFLFDPNAMSTEGSGLRLNVECSRLLNLWLSSVEQWVHDLTSSPSGSLEAEHLERVLACIDDIESGALFLLAHDKQGVYAAGVKAIRLLATLEASLQAEATSAMRQSEEPFRLVTAFLGKVDYGRYMLRHEDMLEPDEVLRLAKWRKEAFPDMALRIANSDYPLDRGLWRHLYPALLQACMEQSSSVLSSFRAKVIAAASRYHSLMVQLSGINNRTLPNLPQRSGSSGDRDASRVINEHRPHIQQWHFWMKLICATAEVSDVRPTVNYPMRDHSRARSEANFERDQMVTTRDLFKYLSQFLDSDHTLFRDVAVSSISSFPSHGYSQLLEDLNVLASRQLSDDPRSKSTSAPVIGRARRQERFHTAVARIYYLTSHALQDQRSASKQTALAHVLKYIRSMHAYLVTPDHRDLFTLQRLRRYFCGTVERLFDGLATLKDSDRFIPPHMHLALFRLCEEWCQLGKQSENMTKRLITMQTAAAKSLSEPADQAEIIQRFQTETRNLSHAAVGAMAALCHKAFYPPEHASASPTDRYTLDSNHKPLQAAPTLDRLTAILASFQEPEHTAGKKALRSLLLHTPSDGVLLDEALRRALVTTRQLETSNARFFEVVADVICNASGSHGFSFSQIAFSILEVIHEQSGGIISLNQYEAAVCSSAPSAYLHAHRSITMVLAGEHPKQAIHVLAQFSGWITRLFDGQTDRSPLLLLQSLEHWVPHITLLDDSKSALSREGRSAIYHLMNLTARYVETYAEQVLVLWSRAVDNEYQLNAYATVMFLLEQAPKIGSTLFISCAAKVVACLFQSAAGMKVFDEMCGLLDPVRMLPSYEHKVTIPAADEIEEWSDLDVLFSESPKLTLTQTQFVLLFLCEATMDRSWPLDKHLPALLMAIFMHVSDKQPFIRERSRHMLFQLLRSCMPGYDDFLDRPLARSRLELKAAIQVLENEAEMRLWVDDDSAAEATPKLKWLSSEVLDLLEPLYPDLRAHWGFWTLRWGTQCLKREMAYRSLQLHRVLAAPVLRESVDMLLGRLAHTIADEDAAIQNFNVEIILTLTSMAASDTLPRTLLPKLFWSTVGCLSTTVENEFLHALSLLEALLAHIDLDDHFTVEMLLEARPPTWSGSSSLQFSLLTGLRSSSTSELTLKVLRRLSGISDARLVDASEGRVRDLYTLSLPLCLHSMASGPPDDISQDFALSIGRLAEEEERPSIDRIMTSFAKGRFRTKEDFLRESVASLREHYGTDHWTEVITLLMSMVLNQERWLRIYTLQILKLLFQQRETRDLLVSELLMPLLRLLETDLAPQALDVLDEPVEISGGPAAKHILRMSLFHHLDADAKEVESVAEVFGIPQESGWCVPRSGAVRDICRSNIFALTDSYDTSSSTSHLSFHPEPEEDEADDADPYDDLGDMVQNLHELSSFFQEENSVAALPHPQLEARVAAILAKSRDVAQELPQTSFVGVFDVGKANAYEDSDESDYDSGSDLFEFDSPAILRFTSTRSRFP
ncbi:predicted protein [Postia placenta Mad-698-R]|nr:predicted protein [Postia placenta Mad-698-R]